MVHRRDDARRDYPKIEGERGRFPGVGVQHAALFGSVARDEQRPDSDIDVLVNLARRSGPVVVATIFDYAGVEEYVASLFPGAVDVVDREALKPRLRSR